MGWYPPLLPTTSHLVPARQSGGAALRVRHRCNEASGLARHQRPVHRSATPRCCAGRLGGAYPRAASCRRCSTDSWTSGLGGINRRLPQFTRMALRHLPSAVGTCTTFGQNSAIHHQPRSDSCWFLVVGLFVLLGGAPPRISAFACGSILRPASSASHSIHRKAICES